MVDYGKTIIYMIRCKDTTVNDVYIGYTASYKRRMSVHKRCAVNPLNRDYNMRMYNVIRSYGGWNNWRIEILETAECSTKLDGLEIEQKWINRLNPSLNTNGKTNK